MVRNYVKKKTHPEVDEREVEAVLIDVVQNKMPIRQAAAVHGLNYATLYYRLQKQKAIIPSEQRPTEANEVDEESRPEVPLKPVSKYQSKYTANQVFTEEEEQLLEDYILKCSSLNYGLTYHLIRKTSYEYAAHLGHCPRKWEEKQIAGIDWLRLFMKRHNKLSLRKPENTSIARTTGFNKLNVDTFQANLKEVLEKYKFTPDKIYNCDETGIPTVVQAPNVVARKGSKQVGQAVSTERGSMITMCAIINAAGNTIPPVFVFPRARFHDSLMTGSVTGSIGLANSPQSGWMTSILFYKVLEHIQKHTSCTKESRILLIMDNHESHCSLENILYARDNGIVILTLPPHCSHRLQPLDVTVLGPFKRALSVTQNDWLVSHPGQKIVISELTGLCSQAYDQSFTRKNIISGFKQCGIWPYSSTVFNEDEFACAPVNEKTSQHGNVDNASNETLVEQTIGLTDRLTTISVEASSPSCSFTQNQSISPGPEVVRPLPTYIVKSGGKGRGGKQPGKSRILTATPEKNRIEQAILEKQERERKKMEHKIERQVKAKKKLEMSSKPKPRPKKPKLNPLPDSSDSDFESVPEYMESDDSPYNESFSDGNSDASYPELETNFPKINPILEKYYAIYYDISWYLGRVIDFPDEGETKVKFLKMGLGDAYDWPKDDDIQIIKNNFLFYGPINLIGNGPFYIDDKCRRRISNKYKQLKRN